MTRWTIALAAVGIGVAAAGGSWLIARGPSTPVPDTASGTAGDTAARSLFGARPEKSRLLSSDAARQQRALRYESFDRVESAQQLPSEFARKEALYVIAGRSDEEQLRGLIAQASALPHESERIGALEILLLRYAEIDADAALRAALELERRTASRLIGALARVAPQKAWTAAAQVDNLLARTELLSAVIGSWTAQEPRQAFLNVAALPEEWPRGPLLRLVTAELSRRDPRLAIELVRSSTGLEKETLLQVVALEWSRQDPPAAARWVESLNVAQQSAVAFQVAISYALLDQEEALAWALRVSRSPTRNLWSHTVAQIATRNPEEAFRLAQSAENPAQRSQATSEVLAAIAARDPVLAISYWRKLAAGEARRQAALQIGLQLASRSPARAVDWLDEIDDRQTRIAVSRGLAQSLASRDVETAAQLVGRVPKEARSSWIHGVAQTYAVDDIEKGVEWVGRYRDDTGNVALGFVHAVAAYDPENALNVVERLTSGRERDELLAGVIPMIATQSPHVAARTFERITDERLRRNTSGAVATALASHDEAAARRWATSLEDGPVRDHALSALVQNIGWSDENLSLLGQIRSPQLRMDIVAQLAAILSQDDPETMRVLLRRYPLDPQRQKELERAARGSSGSN